MTRRWRRVRNVAIALAALAFFGYLGTGMATASPPAPQLVYICQQAPCANAQEFEVFDGNRAPILSVGEYGGAGVFGDQFSVFAPNDVYHPVVQLRDNGTVLVGGQVLTAGDVALLNAMREAGITPRDLRVLAAWVHIREARR